MLNEWLRVFGRFHPLVLHLPIGLLAGVALMELIARRSGPARLTASVLAWFAAVMAVIAAGTGYVLHLEGGYEEGTVVLHMWLGFGVAAGAVLLAIVRSLSAGGARPAAVWVSRGLLVITLGVLVPAGHFGGVLVRGDGYLTAPLRAQANARPGGDRGAREAAPGSREPGEEGGGGAREPAHEPGAPVAESSFKVAVAPIFQARCAGCHNETRRRGGLVLTSTAGIDAGGKDGPILDRSLPGQSELLRRVKLPADDRRHMPPGDKKQLTEAEIKAIETWVGAGAPFEGEVPGLPSSGGAAAPTKPPPPTAPGNAEAGVPAADPGAVAKLREALVHVEPVSRDSHLLWIDFAAVAKATDDARAAALLGAVQNQVADLALNGAMITDKTAELAARMPNLRRLELRGTGVTDAGVAALGKHARLEEIVLAQTRLSDAAVEHLLSLPSLKAVFLWNAGLSGEGVARLRKERPGLHIDVGEVAEAEALETEAEVKLTSAAGAAPAGGQAPAAGAGGGDPLKPVNTVCPVSGTAVNPEYRIVYKGRVIGFCCQHCPVQFWADPEKYVAKLP